MDTLGGEAHDRELTLAFQRGDKGAYQEIYERYSARIQSICRRMVSDPNDAQEVAQEAFLRVYLGLERFNGRYRLGAWVARIATNVCLDHLRARSRKPSEAMPVEIMELESPGFNEDSDPETIHIRRTESRRVYKVLASLPPLHRAAIVLRDFEGLSYEEIAGALKITDCQVKALLHRARKGFRRSWSAGGVAALMPLRWLRRIHEGTREHAGHGSSAYPGVDLATSLGNFAASCPGVIQQCGMLLSERAATIMTTVALGAAAVTGAAVLPSSPEAAQLEEPEVRVAPARTTRDRGGVRDQKWETKGSSPADVAAPPPASAASEAPSDPQPSPAPGTSPSPNPSPNPSPSSSPTPEPQGFSLAFSTNVAHDGDPCSCLAPTAVESEVVRTSEKNGIERFDQTVSGTASAAGSPAYGLRVEHRAPFGTSHYVDFTLKTTEGSYLYSGRGTLSSRARNDWGGWVYTYSGTYEIYSRPSRAESVPQRGAYTTTVVASWRKARLTSVSFSLFETTQ